MSVERLCLSPVPLRDLRDAIGGADCDDLPSVVGQRHRFYHSELLAVYHILLSMLSDLAAACKTFARSAI